MSVTGYHDTPATTSDEQPVTPTVPSSPASAPFRARKAARWPPADSPQTPIASPSTPTRSPNRRSHRTAALTSCRQAGKTASPLNRYSTRATATPRALRARQTGSVTVAVQSRAEQEGAAVDPDHHRDGTRGRRWQQQVHPQRPVAHHPGELDVGVARAARRDVGHGRADLVECGVRARRARGHRDVRGHRWVRGLLGLHT